MKPSYSDIDAVVTAASDLGIPNFPSTAEGKSLLMRFIWQMVSNEKQLHWLLDEAFPRMRRFSLPELRGIFCTRFRPADGIEDTAMETPGFMPADIEHRAHQIEAAETDARLARWKSDLKLLGEPAGKEPLALEAANRMPSRKPVKREIPAAERHAIVADAEKTLHETRSTHRRTDEENARLIRELEEQLGISKT